MVAVAVEETISITSDFLRQWKWWFFPQVRVIHCIVNLTILFLVYDVKFRKLNDVNIFSWDFMYYQNFLFFLTTYKHGFPNSFHLYTQIFSKKRVGLSNIIFKVWGCHIFGGWGKGGILGNIWVPVTQNKPDLGIGMSGIILFDLRSFRVCRIAKKVFNQKWTNLGIGMSGIILFDFICYLRDSGILDLTIPSPVIYPPHPS